MAVLAGAAPSGGAAGRDEDWLPLAARIPVELRFNDTTNVPTVVSAALLPSVRVSVAVLPDVPTVASDPFDGTLVNVHTLVIVLEASVSEKVTVTWSTLPLLLLSSIVIAVFTGAA